VFPPQVENENALQYLERVSPDLSEYFTLHYNDTALYDLTPQGCAVFAATATFAFPDVFYFSHVTSRSTAMMNAALTPFFAAIATVAINPEDCKTGGLTCSSANEWCQSGAPATPTSFCYDATWETNDGLVPYRSARSLELGVPTGDYVGASRRLCVAAWRGALAAND